SAIIPPTWLDCACERAIRSRLRTHLFPMYLVSIESSSLGVPSYSQELLRKVFARPDCCVRHIVRVRAGKSSGKVQSRRCSSVHCVPARLPCSCEACQQLREIGTNCKMPAGRLDALTSRSLSFQWCPSIFGQFDPTPGPYLPNTSGTFRATIVDLSGWA